MPFSVICIDCGRTVDGAVARRSRCPACLAGWKASKPTPKASPEALARKAAHQKVVGSSRWRRTRDLVKARDGACRRCGSTTDLQVHHIVPVSQSEDPFDPEGLVTLCRGCHARADASRRRQGRGF